MRCRSRTIVAAIGAVASRRFGGGHHLGLDVDDVNGPDGNDTDRDR
jgi:hypothetical protein